MANVVRKVRKVQNFIFHNWIDDKGMGEIESWKNKKILISQEEHDKLDETQKIRQVLFRKDRKLLHLV